MSRIFLKIKTSRGFYGSRQDSGLSCCPEPLGFLTSKRDWVISVKQKKQSISLTTLKTPGSQSCPCLSMPWKIRQRHIFMNTSTCSFTFTYLRKRTHRHDFSQNRCLEPALRRVRAGALPSSRCPPGPARRQHVPFFYQLVSQPYQSAGSNKKMSWATRFAQGAK